MCVSFYVLLWHKNNNSDYSLVWNFGYNELAYAHSRDVILSADIDHAHCLPGDLESKH